MAVLCLRYQITDKRKWVKHVGHFGIRFSLEDHQRQRDQMAIECDSQRSNILGHQLICSRDLAPRTQPFPYAWPWLRYIKGIHSPEFNCLLPENCLGIFIVEVVAKFCFYGAYGPSICL